jgi:hypothetical protein
LRHLYIGVFSAVLACALCAEPAAAGGDPFARVIITVSPVYTLNTGGDAIEPAALSVGLPSSSAVPSAGNKAALSDWNLNYSAAWVISKKFNLAYAHVNLNLDYETAHGLAKVPLTLGDVHDRIDTVMINNSPNLHLQQSLAYFHRSRICCPADAQAVSGGGALWSYGGIDQNDYRLTENYSFGPHTLVGYPVTLFATVAYANHPVPANLAANDPLFGGAKYQGSGIYYPAYGIRLTIPTAKRTWVPWIAYSHNESFLREDPAPVQYQLLQYGVNRTLSKNLSLSMAVWNIQQFKESFPLGGIDTLRTAFLVSQLNYTFHL